MKGKLDGTSLRVPVPTGSITDFTGHPRRPRRRSTRSTRRSRRPPRVGPAEGHPRYTEEPIVSQRHRRPTRTRCIFDAGLTMSHGQAGQGARLVRQRVGLLEPPRRHSPCTPARSAAKQEVSAPMTDGIPDARGPRRRRRQAGPGPHRLQRPDATTARSPTTSASAPRCRRSSGCTERGATVVTRQPPRPARRASPTRSTRWTPVRARLAELAPGVELLENLRFDPGEEGNDPAFVATLVDGIDAYVNDAFGAVAPRARLDRRPAADAAVGDGPAAAEGGRGAARPAQRPEAPVRRRARRRQDHRQARRRSRRCSTSSTRSSSAAAMCFTFLAAQGHPIGDSLFEPDQVDTCRRLLAEAATQGKTIHLPDDIVGLDAGGNFATFGTRLPDGAKGLDIGPGTAAAFSDVDHGRPHRVLERPDGHVRGRPLRGRHPHGRPGDGRHQGVHRRRRRRLAPRRWPSSASTTRSTTCPPAAARRSSCSSSATCPASPRCAEAPNADVTDARKPLISGNWKMHHNHFEAIQTRAEAGATCSARTTTSASTCQHAPAVHRHPQRADRASTPTSCAFALGAQHCHWEDKGAFTGEVVAGVPRQARRAATSSSATASGASCSARPTRW